MGHGGGGGKSSCNFKLEEQGFKTKSYAMLMQSSMDLQDSLNQADSLPTCAGGWVYWSNRLSSVEFIIDAWEPRTYVIILL